MKKKETKPAPEKVPIYDYITGDKYDEVVNRLKWVFYDPAFFKKSKHNLRQ